MPKMTLPVFQEPTKLVLLILSFAYANVVKLGHDLTIELFVRTINYDGITRWPWMEKISTVLSSPKPIRTSFLICHQTYMDGATRVYEAYDVGNPNSRVVVKDSWLNMDRPKERMTTPTSKIREISMILAKRSRKDWPKSVLSTIVSFHLQESKALTSCIWPKGPLSNYFQGERSVLPYF